MFDCIRSANYCIRWYGIGGFSSRPLGFQYLFYQFVVLVQVEGTPTPAAPGLLVLAGVPAPLKNSGVAQTAQ